MDRRTNRLCVALLAAAVSTLALSQKAVADASVQERLAKLGISPLVMSQPEFERHFKADVLDTEKLAKAAGIERQ